MREELLEDPGLDGRSSKTGSWKKRGVIDGCYKWEIVEWPRNLEADIPHSTSLIEDMRIDD